MAARLMDGDRLSSAQRDALKRGADMGACYNLPIRMRSGGAYSRMVDRLVIAGLLEKERPNRITANGRASLVTGRAEIDYAPTP